MLLHRFFVGLSPVTSAKPRYNSWLYVEEEKLKNKMPLKYIALQAMSEGQSLHQ